MKTKIILALALVFSTVVHGQTFYHCTKDGKKIISDQPCGIGAKEQKRVDISQMPPINTSQALTESQKQQGQQIDQRNRQQQQIDEQNRQNQIAKQQQEQEINQRVCKDLDRYKNQIISQQRQRSTDWLNSEHKRVNDEMYDRKCKTL